MIRKSIDEIQDGDVLSKPITTWDYQIILQSGAILKKEYVEKLRSLDVVEVWVKEQDEHTEEIGILKEEIEKAVKEKVQDILERHTYHNNQELQQLKTETDYIITNILEESEVVEKVYDIRQRSKDLYEHSVSICTFSVLTALKLNLSIEKVHDIGVGCLLHDIGLRYINIDVVTRGEEDLNEGELAEYKKHPVYGYSNLKDESWISELSKEIVLCHHERLDGSGFPLKKTQLPLECWIVNVCDVFDEMICGITRKQKKVYEAVEYLKSFKGILFDREVVDTLLQFIAVYPTGSKVMTNEGEEGIVVAQNKDFQDRPVLRILKDKNGNDVKEEKVKNLMEIHSLFIDKIIE